MNIPERMNLVTVRTSDRIVHVPMLLNDQEAHKFRQFAEHVTHGMGGNVTISVHERLEAPELKETP